jgi:hypothetical protein
MAVCQVIGRVFRRKISSWLPPATDWSRRGQTACSAPSSDLIGDDRDGLEGPAPRLDGDVRVSRYRTHASVRMNLVFISNEFALRLVRPTARGTAASFLVTDFLSGHIDNIRHNCHEHTGYRPGQFEVTARPRPMTIGSDYGNATRGRMPAWCCSLILRARSQKSHRRNRRRRDGPDLREMAVRGFQEGQRI